MRTVLEAADEFFAVFCGFTWLVPRRLPLGTDVFLLEFLCKVACAVWALLLTVAAL